MSSRPASSAGSLRPLPSSARPRVRSTLDFAALHDHARLPARFFGRILAVGAAALAG